MSIKELSFLLIQHGVSFDCKMIRLKLIPMRFLIIMILSPLLAVRYS